jgi:hypothetical protein
MPKEAWRSGGPVSHFGYLAECLTLRGKRIRSLIIPLGRCYLPSWPNLTEGRLEPIAPADRVDRGAGQNRALDLLIRHGLSLRQRRARCLLDRATSRVHGGSPGRSREDALDLSLRNTTHKKRKPHAEEHSNRGLCAHCHALTLYLRNANASAPAGQQTNEG